MYLSELSKDLAQDLYTAFQKAGWKHVTIGGGGGNHFGIIAGAGKTMASRLKTAIESTTPLKVELDKADQPEWGDHIYLFVGINRGR